MKISTTLERQLEIQGLVGFGSVCFLLFLEVRFLDGFGNGFLSILDGFWDALGSNFWVILALFHDLGQQGCSMGSRVGFLVIWEW